MRPLRTLLLALPILVTPFALTSAAARPNLLIITADDLNHDSWLNSPVHVTPNLDRLAAACVRFEHCHLAAPICQPSREALMTGRVPHRSGGLGFTPIRLDVPTLTEITASNGYFTAVINKSAHMAPKEKFNWELTLEGSGKNPAALRAQFEQCLKTATEKQQPFFINANITDPHRPFPGSDAETDRAQRPRKKKNASANQAAATSLIAESAITVPPFLEDLPPIRKEMAQYFSGVRRMDQSLGGLLEALQASGQETNTVLVFLADNGLSAPFAKATVYRNGTLSPLLVRWPGMGPPRVEREAMISSVDIMPTVLDLLSLPSPPAMDGRSLLSLLKGESQPDRDHVFTSVNTVSSGKAFPQRCVRTKTRAYMYHPWSDGQTRFRVEAMSGLSFNAMLQAAQKDPRIQQRVEQYLIRTREEFFDLTRDPDERQNLIHDPKYQREIQSMRQLLLAEMDRSNDPLLGSFKKDLAPSANLIESIGLSDATGGSLAVIVPDVPLVHTSQILPFDAKGNLIERQARDAHEQAAQVLANLDQALRTSRALLARCVKLNVYLKRAQDLAAVKDVISARFETGVKPAISFVVGDLPDPTALVAMDAIAPLESQRTFETPALPYPQPGSTTAAVLPAGPKLFVSGMADTNALPVATKKTLEKLLAAISHLGLNRSHIIQLKSFLQPMSDVAQARQEIVQFFNGQAPPLVFVEWISKAPNPPIEIELIATVPDDLSKETDTVSYLTPPGTTGSKVYSRIARVNQGKLIYFAGLYGHRNESGAIQIREIFEELKSALPRCGSDLEHLVKATYYVSDDEASNQLNQIRPEYYHPQRPPAASKAKVKGVGLPGKTVTLDMIAVSKNL